MFTSSNIPHSSQAIYRPMEDARSYYPGAYHVVPWTQGTRSQRFQLMSPEGHFSAKDASGNYSICSLSDLSVLTLAHKDEPSGNPPQEKQDRRRAQNRAAQRAYRGRKELVRQELEAEVKQWQDRHQALRESYQQQAQELRRLKEQAEELLERLSTIRDLSPTEGFLSSDFDLFPYVDWNDLGGSEETPSA